MATDIEPQDFDPLRVSPEDPLAAIHYARNRVKNIVESYHGRFDALAEGVQNAMDAIEARWRDWDGKSLLDEATSADERPTLRIRIHSDTNVIEFVDNGIGIRQADVVESLIPNVSPKGTSAEATRGHKGVGTTFLAYGHDRFTIQRSTTGQARQPMSPSPSPMALVGSTAIRTRLHHCSNGSRRPQKI